MLSRISTCKEPHRFPPEYLPLSIIISFTTQVLQYFFVLATWPVHCIPKDCATCYCSIKDQLNIDFIQGEDRQSNINSCVQTLYLELTLSCSFSLYFFINTCVPSCRIVRLFLFSQQGLTSEVKQSKIKATGSDWLWKMVSYILCFILLFILSAKQKKKGRQ